MCTDRCLSAGQRRRPQCGTQYGQALVETLVACLAMIPLLIGITAIGKLLDVRHSTIAASRTAAFECTVRIVECSDPDGRATIQDEIRRRHFLRDDREVLSADAAPERVPATERVLGWTDRSALPLMDRLDSVQTRVSRQRLDAPASHLRSNQARIATAGVRLLDEIAGPARFNLQTWDGLQVAEVLAPVSTSDIAVRTPLRLRARTAVLVDGWGASGPEGTDAASVRTRVSAGQSPPALEPIADVGYATVRVLMQAMRLLQLEPAAGAYRHRWIDMDVVPADRRPEQ